LQPFLTLISRKSSY